MKMTLGSGTISQYGSYSNNCTRNQYPYKIPVNNLQDVQLYISIGGIKPEAVQYELIHTCGALGGTIETLATPDYVIGQSSDNYWYGVFKNFSNPSDTPVCFVIAITLTITSVDYIYFSDEFCVETCQELTEIKGCYGNLDSAISVDRQGIYFGVHAGSGTALGDETVKYEHKLLLRSVELSLAAIKKTFKQGRTRNFRTESEDIYQFFAEWVPEWYIREIGAVYDRGEVFIGGTKYLVEAVGFEKIEDCKRVWKPSATLKESYYQSFSCEVDPCAAATPTCCDPASVTATVEHEDSGESPCCDPEIIDASVSTETFYEEMGIAHLAFGQELYCTPVTGVAHNNVPLVTGRLYIALVSTSGTSSFGTLSGTIETWESIFQSTDGTRNIAIYRCMPVSDTSDGDLTVSWAFGFYPDTVLYRIYEITGATLGSNGADAIEQVVVSDPTTGSNPQIILSDLRENNLVLAFFANNQNPFGGAPLSGWTEDQDNGCAEPFGSYVMYRINGVDNEPTIIAASSDWIGAAIEFKGDVDLT